MAQTKDEKSAYLKRWLQTANGKRSNASRRLKSLYGITLGEYETMLVRQDSRCAMCGSTEAGGAGKRFHVDHCHRTGVVRGLLCSNCNTSLGHFEKIKNLAVQYLEAAECH